MADVDVWHLEIWDFEFGAWNLGFQTRAHGAQMLPTETLTKVPNVGFGHIWDATA
jgi:hypothetical protein